jgi:hypothetical protein
MSNIDTTGYHMTPEESYEALENLDCEINIFPSEYDTELKLAEEHIEKNKEEILKQISKQLTQNSKLRAHCLEKWKENENMIIGFIIENGQFKYDCYIGIGCSDSIKGPNIIVDVYSKKYLDNRPEYLKSIFPKKCKIGDISKNIPNLPVLDFGMKKNGFNVQNVSDLRGVKVDINIKELIQLLNDIGLRTTKSCGGHIDQRFKPYIHFAGDHGQLEKVVSLFLEWKKTGGVDYLINSLDLNGSVLTIESPEDVSIEESIEDIRHLTDWLKDKIENQKSKI